MSLTRSQKKYLKKHAKQQSVASIAAALSVPEADVAGYLQKRSGTKAHSFSDNRTVLTETPQSVFDFRRWWTMYIGLLTLVAAAYVNSLRNAFVSDDVRYLVQNPDIRSFKFVTDTPVTVFKALLDWLTYRWFGLSPWAFHLLNIGFHLLAVWCLFAVLRLYTQKWTAAAAAAILAVHPIFTESVTWIGGGGYVMYGALFLLSTLLYLTSDGHRGRYAASVGVFALALLSSEKTIPLALMFPVYELTGLTKTRRFRRTVPHLTLSVIWLVLFFTVFRYAQARIAALESQFSVSGYYNPLTQIPVALSSYIWLTLFPKDLSFFHSQLKFPIWEFAVRALAAIIFTVVTVYTYFKDRLTFAFLILIPVSLSPSLTPLAIAWVVAERYGYLAAVAIISAIVITSARLAKSRRSRKVLTAIVVTAVSLLLLRTVIRNIDWTNEDTLWFATYRTAPLDPRVHNNVGEYFLRRREFTKAETELKTAISLSPSRPLPYYNLGQLYYQTGRFKDAETNLTQAISIDPSFAAAYRLLASVYFDQKQYAKALPQLLTLNKLTPEKSLVYLNLGLVYQHLQKQQQAEAALRHALRLDPENRAAQQALSSGAQ